MNCRIKYDYYPFGMAMPGRTFNSSEYRYGFNGMEKDDEIAGRGNSYTAEFWQYDSRLGRRWNIDPITYASQSPYASFNNNPIFFSDPSGLEGNPPEKNNPPEEFKRGKKIGDPNVSSGGYNLDELSIISKIPFWKKVGNFFKGVGIAILDAGSWIDNIFQGSGDYSDYIDGSNTLINEDALNVNGAAINGNYGQFIETEELAAVAGGAKAGSKQFGQGRFPNMHNVLKRSVKIGNEVKSIRDTKSNSNKPVLSKATIEDVLNNQDKNAEIIHSIPNKGLEASSDASAQRSKIPLTHERLPGDTIILRRNYDTLYFGPWADYDKYRDIK